MAIIIFDTETFGLINSLDMNIESLEFWPPIKQICWQTYDLNGNLIENNNHYFQEPNENKTEVLSKFILDFENSELAVAHNFLFDFKVISAELIRHKLSNEKLEGKAIYDSMLSNINLCQIITKFGKYKYPTLTELYVKLFNEPFIGAHDALNDVQATADCFWNLRYDSKINFDELPNVKKAIQLEEEKIIEELNIFYGSRKQFGDFVFDSCACGTIGYMIEKIEKERKKEKLSSLNIRSNSNLMLQWILELEKVFLKSPTNKKLFNDYVIYKSLQETMEYLDFRNIYFPRKSGKIAEAFVYLYLADKKKKHLDKLVSYKLYDIISNMIKEYEELKVKFEKIQHEMVNKSSGCMVGLILFLIIFVTNNLLNRV